MKYTQQRMYRTAERLAAALAYGVMSTSWKFRSGLEVDVGDENSISSREARERLSFQLSGPGPVCAAGGGG